METMCRTGEGNGGGLWEGDEVKKIYNLTDNERKIILSRKWKTKRTKTKDNRAFTLHLAYETLASFEKLAPFYKNNQP